MEMPRKVEFDVEIKCGRIKGSKNLFIEQNYNPKDDSGNRCRGVGCLFLNEVLKVMKDIFCENMDEWGVPDEEGKVSVYKGSIWCSRFANSDQRMIGGKLEQYPGVRRLSGIIMVTDVVKNCPAENLPELPSRDK